MTLNQHKSELKAASFCEYSSARPFNHEYAESRWQLRILDENGKTKYFINAYLYKRIEPHLQDGIEFDAVLYQPEHDNEWITVELHGSNVGSALRFFQDTYKALGCEPDRHNN